MKLIIICNFRLYVFISKGAPVYVRFLLLRVSLFCSDILSVFMLCISSYGNLHVYCWYYQLDIPYLCCYACATCAKMHYMYMYMCLHADTCTSTCALLLTSTMTVQ